MIQSILYGDGKCNRIHSREILSHLPHDYDFCPENCASYCKCGSREELIKRFIRSYISKLLASNKCSNLKINDDNEIECESPSGRILVIEIEYTAGMVSAVVYLIDSKESLETLSTTIFSDILSTPESFLSYISA